ncbi:prepilin-type N-terminal cleavage/methylation domain-containing protein [Steroidobacter cummioxidans]|uniref:prepilin-type N-terminal cleavage/methylation domain-containing protein n=1 Tax=Steroidobacter cummioxidans TaxID=1803913 RepID=UPI000E30B7D5|nr:prepilin-type N-terminal cleavage/methylation domain-containing protein [Steroidobacter cummioxidans]
MSKHLHRCLAGRNGGFTLVELMVAMILGLVIIGGATGVIIANRQSYRTNEGLSQLQESARTAFELMARDIRQAGVTGCDSNGRIANVLDQTDPRWWKTWFAMRGFSGNDADGAAVFGTGTLARVEGTDSLLVQGLDGNGIAVQSHRVSDAVLKLNSAPTSIAAGDVMMVCNFSHAAIFAVRSYNATDTEVNYAVGGSGLAAHNCSQGLGYPTNCPNNNLYQYSPGSQVARLMAVDWYVGINSRGGRSLFRKRMELPAEEIVAGVSNMTLTYLQEGGDSFQAPAAVTNWSNVTAVRVGLTIDSIDQRISSDASVNEGRLQREFANVITLRNRVL